jgi:hypothetical protein
MGRSTSDSFVRRRRNAAAKQYCIPYVLKGYHKEFSQNRLYPSLPDPVDLCGVLESLLQTKVDIEGRHPQRLKETDLVNRRLVYEP